MSENNHDSNKSFDGAAIIFSYSRAQAIEDGELIDVTPMAKEAGFKHPTVISRGVHSEVVVPPEAAVGESESGRLWDILWVLRLAIAKGTGNQDKDRIYFQVLATDDEGKQTLRRLWCQCGPGDTAEPVLTIMLQGED